MRGAPLVGASAVVVLPVSAAAVFAGPLVDVMAARAYPGEVASAPMRIPVPNAIPPRDIARFDSDRNMSCPLHLYVVAVSPQATGGPTTSDAQKSARSVDSKRSSKS